MIIVSSLFAILHLTIPPLILGIWVTLLFRFGALASLFRQAKLLIYHQKRPAVRSQTTWLVLLIGVFGIFLVLFFGLNLLLGDRLKDLETSILGERNYSIVFTFLYSPVGLILVLEAWLMLLSYFGLHNFHGLAAAFGGERRVKEFTVPMFQFGGILTGLIGFGWWSYLGAWDPNRAEAILNFSVVVLSPITVLLVAGLVVILFISLSKITALEENAKHSEQIARRMTLILLVALVILSASGGLLSILIHYDRLGWYGIGR